MNTAKLTSYVCETTSWRKRQAAGGWVLLRIDQNRSIEKNILSALLVKNCVGNKKTQNEQTQNQINSQTTPSITKKSIPQKYTKSPSTRWTQPNLRAVCARRRGEVRDRQQEDVCCYGSIRSVQWRKIFCQHSLKGTVLWGSKKTELTNTKSTTTTTSSITKKNNMQK